MARHDIGGPFGRKAGAGCASLAVRHASKRERHSRRAFARERL